MWASGVGSWLTGGLGTGGLGTHLGRPMMKQSQGLGGFRLA